MGNYIELGEGGSELQVRVGNGALGVGKGDQAGGNVRWKWSAPEAGLRRNGGIRAGEKKDAAHASTRRILSAEDGDSSGDDLAKASGPRSQVFHQEPNVIQKVMDGRTEAQPSNFFVSEGILKEAKHAPKTGDGK